MELRLSLNVIMWKRELKIKWNLGWELARNETQAQHNLKQFFHNFEGFRIKIYKSKSETWNWNLGRSCFEIKKNCKSLTSTYHDFGFKLWTIHEHHPRYLLGYKKLLIFYIWHVCLADFSPNEELLQSFCQTLWHPVLHLSKHLKNTKKVIHLFI